MCATGNTLCAYGYQVLKAEYDTTREFVPQQAASVPSTQVPKTNFVSIFHMQCPVLIWPQTLQTSDCFNSTTNSTSNCTSNPSNGPIPTEEVIPDRTEIPFALGASHVTFFSSRGGEFVAVANYWDGWTTHTRSAIAQVRVRQRPTEPPSVLDRRAVSVH